MISRKETQEILSLLNDDTNRIVVVHGAAGSGKSGTLLELAQELIELGDVVLPIRLDRVELRGNPRRFGRNSLSLPDSPGRCLAIAKSERRAVLLLDQLDALRWTGAHSSEAWDVCRETILDALTALPTTKIVVCCRTFDLQHDPQLRNWKENSKNLREVRVGDLLEEQVRKAVERAVFSRGEARPIDDDRELKLLRHIHHLQMWLILYPKLDSKVFLGTRRALMEAFWEDRRTRLAEFNISPDRIETIEARLVDSMQEGARLTAPLGALQLNSKEVSAYQSLHIFQVDSERSRLSFSHQSYLDYLVALRIVKELTQGNKSLLTWLGARDEQDLFRREQLRLILEELRDQNANAYVTQLRTLIQSDQETRFHLRLLCLQFLSQINDPFPAERQLVLELLANPDWHEHVLGDVVRGQAAWFEVLDDVGIFERWLGSDDKRLRDSALEILLYVVETRGDRVARLLRPYLGRDEEWTQRILWVLRFDPTKDSEALFDLRLELTKQGADTAEHVGWSELATKHPIRFLSLVCHLLLSLAKNLLEGQERRRAGRRSELDWYHFEKVTPTLIPVEVRGRAWELLFKAVMSIAQIRRYKSEKDYVLESYAVTFETLEPIIRLLRDLGRFLLEENWVAFVSLGESLTKGDRRKEVLFLDSLQGGPEDSALADWALGWMMADPWRARLRTRQRTGYTRLPSQLIERYASICSEEIFRRFEEWLLAYTEPDLLKQFQQHRQWMKNSGNLSRPSPFGRTQHALLPKLPPNRVSNVVLKRIAEVTRKFGPPEASKEQEWPKAGHVCSPLGHQRLQRMSDRALLELVASGKLRSNSRYDRLRWRGGHFEEASPETIASDFRIATQREPERFGRLLTLWPSDGHPTFLKAILQGLAFPENAQPDVETWKPPSHELLEAILSLPVVQNLARNEEGPQIGENLCDFLQRYAEYPWTDSVLDFLVWAAQHHPDPSPDYYPVGSDGHDSDHFNHLENNALNVTRGRAAYAVQSLLFEHPEFLPKLRPAIESLIRDPHPAVRAAALETCLPVINIAKDQAVAWFLEASERSPDQLLATCAAREFLRCACHSHLSRLLSTLDRMVASPFQEVATAGAACVAATYLMTDQIEERFERCITGTPKQRKGVAQVAASLIGEGEYAEKATATLLRLAEDTDENVAQEVASSFRELDLQRLEADREAWSRFARSRAFQADPTPLLLALEKQSGNLLPFADCLLTVGETFAKELAGAARNHARGFAGDAHYLLPLLLRLYEQAKEGDQVVYGRCLDLWDLLLERRVGSAMGLTREIDRL